SFRVPAWRYCCPATLGAAAAGNNRTFCRGMPADSAGLSCQSARSDMGHHQLYAFAAAKLVDVQLVGQIGPAHAGIGPDVPVDVECNAVQRQRTALAANHHLQMPFANQTLFHQLEHSMEHGLGEMLPPRTGVTQRLGQLQVELLDAELTVSQQAT